METSQPRGGNGRGGKGFDEAARNYQRADTFSSKGGAAAERPPGLKPDQFSQFACACSISRCLLCIASTQGTDCVCLHSWQWQQRRRRRRWWSRRDEAVLRAAVRPCSAGRRRRSRQRSRKELSSDCGAASTHSTDQAVRFLAHLACCSACAMCTYAPGFQLRRLQVHLPAERGESVSQLRLGRVQRLRAQIQSDWACRACCARGGGAARDRQHLSALADRVQPFHRRRRSTRL